MSENHDPMKPDGDVNPISTDYKIGQDNIVLNLGPFGLDIHNRVFAISALAVISFVVLTLMFQAQAEPMFDSIRGWLTSNSAAGPIEGGPDEVMRDLDLASLDVNIGATLLAAGDHRGLA